LAHHEAELSILFTNDREIARLNEQYLKRVGPTDVLAFPMAGGPEPDVASHLLGDVVVSVDSASQEAEQLREPLEYTIDRLLIHGILHLLGYDHEASEAEAEIMEKEQDRLLTMIGEE